MQNNIHVSDNELATAKEHFEQAQERIQTLLDAPHLGESKEFFIRVKDETKPRLFPVGSKNTTPDQLKFLNQITDLMNGKLYKAIERSKPIAEKVDKLINKFSRTVDYEVNKHLFTEAQKNIINLLGKNNLHKEKEIFSKYSNDFIKATTLDDSTNNTQPFVTEEMRMMMSRMVNNITILHNFAEEVLAADKLHENHLKINKAINTFHSVIKNERENSGLGNYAKPLNKFDTPTSMDLPYILERLKKGQSTPVTEPAPATRKSIIPVDFIKKTKVVEFTR